MKTKNLAGAPKKPLAFVLLAALGVGIAASTAADTKRGDKTPAKSAGSVAVAAPAYRNAVTRTANMAGDAKAQRLAQKHGLQVLNLTWEDTGRYQNSSVGPNISDMTIQVATRAKPSGPLSVAAMPVIRFPNFSDKTADLAPRDFTLLVGNQKPGSGTPTLRRISLYDFLESPAPYLSHAGKWPAKKKSLLAPDRDARVLVSAQACFLPVPKQGQAVFNPVLFNYQSERGNPAVLTVLATREGTSTTIIDNARDAFETGSVWGQRLFHNLHGKRTSLTGTRESDFRAGGGDALSGQIGPTVGPDEGGLNMVLLIQIPLKQKERPRRIEFEAMDKAAPMAAPSVTANRARAASNVENAVIGHGQMEGPYTEMDNLPIERDPKFPVRVTVQFYKATDNGIVSPEDLSQIAAQIGRVYGHGDAVGSLVTGGSTGRITEYEGAKVQPAGWWNDFWRRHKRETGDSPGAAKAKLAKLLGQNYEQRPVTDLYVHTLLKRKR